jgi:hypothetical protein
MVWSFSVQLQFFFQFSQLDLKTLHLKGTFHGPDGLSRHLREISKESEISCDEVPRSKKMEKEDERLRMVETWHRDLE